VPQRTRGVIVPGPQSVTVFNTFGCAATSQEINIVHHNVTEPVITDNGTELNANASGSFYQWYLDGQPIENLHGVTLPLQGPGAYTVEVTDGNGCISESEPYEVLAVSSRNIAGSEFCVWPVPALDVLHVSLGSERQDNTVLEMMTSDGRTVMLVDATANNNDIITMDVSGLAAGTRQGDMRCSNPRPVICATPSSLIL